MQVIISTSITLGVLAFFFLCLRTEGMNPNVKQKHLFTKEFRSKEAKRVSRSTAQEHNADSTKTQFGSSSSIWMLKVYDPESGETTTYPIQCEDKDVSVGRASTSDIKLSNLTVSRTAFIIGYDENIFIAPQISKSTGDFANIFKKENGKFYKLTSSMDVYDGLVLYTDRTENSVKFEFVNNIYGKGRTKIYRKESREYAYT